MREETRNRRRPAGRSEAPIAAAHAADRARRRYDRVAPCYELLEAGLEIRVRRLRRELWSRAPPGRILEIGVGTGLNIPCYPEGAEVVGIDVSERMLARARRRAARLGAEVRLELADLQAIPFPDGIFDAVVGTFVLCSVPDPRRGLAELLRVLRPGGLLLLLEHVVSPRPLFALLQRGLDLFTGPRWGEHFGRDTVAAVFKAGFAGVTAEDVAAGGIVKRIEAFAPVTPADLLPS